MSAVRESIQLEFQLFEKTESQVVREEMLELKKSLDNLRKGLFKRHSNLAQEITEIRFELIAIQNQLSNIEKFVSKI